MQYSLLFLFLQVQLLASISFSAAQCPSSDAWAVVAGSCVCNTGYYLNATQCTACPYGFSNSAPGSTSLASCSLCAPGFYPVGLACALCPLDHYKTSPGNQSCTPCGIGTTTSGWIIGPQTASLQASGKIVNIQSYYFGPLYSNLSTPIILPPSSSVGQTQAWVVQRNVTLYRKGSGSYLALRSMHSSALFLPTPTGSHGSSNSRIYGTLIFLARFHLSITEDIAKFHFSNAGTWTLTLSRTSDNKICFWVEGYSACSSANYIIPGEWIVYSLRSTVLHGWGWSLPNFYRNNTLITGYTANVPSWAAGGPLLTSYIYGNQDLANFQYWDSDIGESTMKSIVSQMMSVGFNPSSTPMACECPLGTFGINGTNNCTPCPVGKSTPVTGSLDASECSMCASGYFLNGSSCDPCRMNTYKNTDWNIGSCVSCPTMTSTNATGSNMCPFCAAGNYVAGYQSCAACPAHSFRNVSHAETSCLACPIGFIAPNTGTLNCIYRCPIGAVWIHPANYCVCDTSYYLAPNGECWPCPFNSYKSTQDNSSCTNCSVFSVTSENYFNSIPPAPTIISSIAGIHTFHVLATLGNSFNGSIPVGTNISFWATGAGVSLQRTSRNVPYLFLPASGSALSNIVTGVSITNQFAATVFGLMRCTGQPSSDQVLYLIKYPSNGMNAYRTANNEIYHRYGTSGSTVYSPSNFIIPNTWAIYSWRISHQLGHAFWRNDQRFAAASSSWPTTAASSTTLAANSYISGMDLMAFYYYPYAMTDAEVSSTRTNLFTLLSSKQDPSVCECSAGYNGSSSSSCSPCPLQTYKQSIGDENCALCPLGSSTQFTASNSSSLCSMCAPGWHWTGSICVACPIGSYKEGHNRDTTCTICDTGRTTSGAGQSVCDTCMLGYYGDGTTCFPCPVGTFANDTGSSSCHICSSLFNIGSTTSGNGSSSPQDCNLCEPGYQYDSGSCYPCSPGFYKIGTNSDSCSLCAATGSTSLAASISCDLCSAGYQRVNMGCIECPQGQYKSGNNTQSCIPCPAGASSLSAGATSVADCSGCSDGFELVNLTCTACPLGYYKNSSLQLCVSCQNTNPFFTTNGTGATSTDNCSLCMPGYQLSSNGQSCELVPIGTYSATASRDPPLACPLGSTTSQPGSTSSSACSLCMGGYRKLANGGCQICYKGEWKFGNNTATSCQKCTNGKTTQFTNVPYTSESDCINNMNGAVGVIDGAANFLASLFGGQPINFEDQESMPSIVIGLVFVGLVFVSMIGTLIYLTIKIKSFRATLKGQNPKRI